MSKRATAQRLPIPTEGDADVADAFLIAGQPVAPVSHSDHEPPSPNQTTPVSSRLILEREPDQELSTVSNVLDSAEKQSEWLTWERADPPRFRRILPPPPPDRHSIETLQQWEGTVIETGKSEFTASLRGLMGPAHEEEQATFVLHQVRKDDLDLVLPGAVFYWSVGYRTEEHGQVSTFGAIRFRRLPTWTAKDLEQLSKAASRLTPFFDLDEEADAS